MTRLFFILISAYLLTGCIEDCSKDYLISGHVVDQTNAPVDQAKIRWHYDDPSTPESILGYSDSSGNYSIPYKTRSSLKGSTIEFVKPGFTTKVGDAFTESEAGSSKCGNVNLVRDVTLLP